HGIDIQDKSLGQRPARLRQQGMGIDAKTRQGNVQMTLILALTKGLEQEKCPIVVQNVRLWRAHKLQTRLGNAGTSRQQLQNACHVYGRKLRL
ncbi:hypothetical protein HAX54_011015, partial [Datura stramonium]|nr:hypothetical protein [Datura stramonium]